MVVVGGLASIWGAIFGTATVTLLGDLLHGLWRDGHGRLRLDPDPGDGLHAAGAVPRGRSSYWERTRRGDEPGPRGTVDVPRREFGGLVALDDVIWTPNWPGHRRHRPQRRRQDHALQRRRGGVPPDPGRGLPAGQPRWGRCRRRRGCDGDARTFQSALLFGNMTVLENVMVGRHTRGGSGFFSAALPNPGLPARGGGDLPPGDALPQPRRAWGQGGESAGALPFGQQRLLAIARALATEPMLLLLDEPGAGLNALEKCALADLIFRIREMGPAVLLVEHDMELVMQLRRPGGGAGLRAEDRRGHTRRGTAGQAGDRRVPGRRRRRRRWMTRCSK